MRENIHWQRRLADEIGDDDIEWEANENTLLWEGLERLDLEGEDKLGEEDAEWEANEDTIVCE
jgi:hypothetical protein